MSAKLDEKISFNFHSSQRSQPVDISPSQLAVIMVDMWNTHWSPIAEHRAQKLAPVVNGFLSAARELGIQIIHAPSQCQNAHKDAAQLLQLHAVPYEADQWRQEVTREQIIYREVWGKKAWLREDFNFSRRTLYDDKKDEAGMEAPSNWNPDRQNPTIVIAPKDRMVIDDYRCTESNCPKLNNGNDGHFHLAQFLDQLGIKYLLYIGIHTNYCVVFTRPYSLWPMSTFTKKGKPGNQVFQCVLIRDLTDAFVHPVNPGDKLTHYTGTEAFVKWLMSSEDTIHGGPKDNFDANKGYIASTISWTELMNFENPSAVAGP